MIENAPGWLMIIAILAVVVAVIAGALMIDAKMDREDDEDDFADSMLAPEVDTNADLYSVVNATIATDNDSGPRQRRFVELCAELHGRRVSIGHISRETKIVIIDRPVGGKAVVAEVVVGTLFDGPKIDVVKPSIVVVDR